MQPGEQWAAVYAAADAAGVVVVGGAAVRIATGGVDNFARMRPAHAITDPGGYLYLRYTRAR